MICGKCMLLTGKKTEMRNINRYQKTETKYVELYKCPNCESYAEEIHEGDLT